MRSAWRTAKLGELVSFKTGKLDSNAAVPNGEYPFFTCSQETLRTNTYSFDTECVLLAGNNANGIYPLKYFHGKFDAYQRTYVVTPHDTDLLTTKFLYYALRPKLSELRSFSTGAATKFLTMTILNQTEIELPPLPVQRRIAGILSAYDELMENNRRRIRLLEAMARALYREWFVRPCQAGNLPKGWEIARLGDHLSALDTGKRPKGGATGSDGGVPSIGAENVNGIGNHDYAAEKFVPREYFDQMRKGIVQDRDVALYKDGAYIGRSSYFRDGFPHAECCVNEHVFLLRSNGVRLTQNALYLWMREPDNIHAMRATNSNAAQPGINQQSMNGLEIVVPTPEFAKRFDETVETMLAQIINLAKRNQNLRRTRDLLLPRLLSGQVKLGKDEG